MVSAVMAMEAYYFKEQFYNYLIPLSAVLEGKGFEATGESASDADKLQEQSRNAKLWIQDLVCVRETDFKRFLVAFNFEQKQLGSENRHLIASPTDPGMLLKDASLC